MFSVKKVQFWQKVIIIYPSRNNMFDLSRKFDFSWQYISRIVCPTNLFFVGGESSKPRLTEPGINFLVSSAESKVMAKMGSRISL